MNYFLNFIKIVDLFPKKIYGVCINKNYVNDNTLNCGGSLFSILIRFSPFSSSELHVMKILLVYPNFYGMNMLPPAIGLFTAILKREGYDVRLFDTTIYENLTEFNSDIAMS